jgi:hypothetical protein
MSDRSPNLMSALYPWASRQGENFTSESLVWVLRILLLHEADEAINLISWLCFAQDGALTLPVNIGTQRTIEEGRPDISIEAPGILVFMEVKTESPLGPSQVNRYLAGLEREQMTRRGALVLLTKDAPELSVEQEKVVRCVRWHEVASRLRSAMIKSAEAKAAIEMLVGFLKERIMTVEHVGWEYSHGVTALRRLLVMLDVALTQAGIPRHIKANAWDFVGYYLDEKRYWAGIRYEEPHLLVFGYENKAKPDPIKIKQSKAAFRDASWGPELVLDLSSEEVHIHSCSAEGQLERLTKFVREAYQVLKECDESQLVLPA